MMVKKLSAFFFKQSFFRFAAYVFVISLNKDVYKLCVINFFGFFFSVRQYEFLSILPQSTP